MSVSPETATSPSSTSPDRSGALEEAMRVFWERGYEGASIQILVDRTGMHRANLYSAFRSKAELFIEALDHYTARRLKEVEGFLAAGPALDQLRAMASSQVEPPPEGHPPSCLVLRTTLGQGFEVPGVPQRVDAFLASMRGILASTIERAQADGSAQAGRDPELLAEVFLIGMQGMCGARVCDREESRRAAIVSQLVSMIAGGN
jgi:TetR/AcrR family transcriptional repressor of nem operon